MKLKSYLVMYGLQRSDISSAYAASSCFLHSSSTSFFSSLHTCSQYWYVGFNEKLTVPEGVKYFCPALKNRPQ